MTESVPFSPSPSGDHTLIVIPTYNEMSTLPTILGDIWANVPCAHVLIVDDIITTGATMVSCAKELMTAPDVRISILSIGVTRNGN